MSPASTVTPVVDYEPPAGVVRHHHPSPPRRPTRSAPPVLQPAAVSSPALRTAGAFADAALRRVLEVVDRRRPPAQLRPLLSAALIDSLTALTPAIGTSGGAAVLRRVRLQPIGGGDVPAAAEVFGTYTRGIRTHAIACRIQPAPGDSGPRWQVVALHIG